MKESDQMIFRVPSSSTKYLPLNKSLGAYTIIACESLLRQECATSNHAKWVRLLFLVKKVFKLDPNSKGGPLLILGRSMQPGSDQNHFCQHTDVAVDPDTGTIYVSDGYCNSRIVQFSPTGTFITQWGEGTQ